MVGHDKPEGELAFVEELVLVEELESAEEIPAAEIEPIDLPLGLPKYAGLFGKIVFAPCNAWFFAGAWLEKTGFAVLLAFGLIITLWLLY